MHYGWMRWRKEKPTCHVSLGWQREADYDMHLHPSLLFWQDIFHHGWAKGKSNTSTLSVMRQESPESLWKLCPFPLGLGQWHMPHSLWQERYSEENRVNAASGINVYLSHRDPGAVPDLSTLLLPLSKPMHEMVVCLHTLVLQWVNHLARVYLTSHPKATQAHWRIKWQLIDALLHGNFGVCLLF